MGLKGGHEWYQDSGIDRIIEFSSYFICVVFARICMYKIFMMATDIICIRYKSNFVPRVLWNICPYIPHIVCTCVSSFRFLELPLAVLRHEDMLEAFFLPIFQKRNDRSLMAWLRGGRAVVV